MAQAVKINWKAQAIIRNRAASRAKPGSDSKTKKKKKTKEESRGPLFYLLLPEVHKLMELELDPSKRLMFQTLWFTGAKLAEVLTLTPSSFTCVTGGILVTFRQGRTIPVMDSVYREDMLELIKQTRYSKTKKIWPVTRQSPFRWHQALMEKAHKKRMFNSMPVVLSTYRHSFAMNWLIHSAPVHLLEGIMGFKHPDRVNHYIHYLEYDQDKYFKMVRFR